MTGDARRLVEKWRKDVNNLPDCEAGPARAYFDGCASRLLLCANELESALSPEAVPSLQDYVERAKVALPHLCRLTAVVFQEGDQWCVIGKEIYQAAHGPTRQQAINAFRRCLILDVLLHMNPNVVAAPACPDDTWAELTGRSGAQISTFQFTEQAEVVPSAPAGLRARLHRLFDSYIETEEKAARQLVAGANERVGAEAETYQQTANAYMARVNDWRQLYARLDFDLFEVGSEDTP